MLLSSVMPLHSNMFLLILHLMKSLVIRKPFTFQYVSINTLIGSLLIDKTPFFTFQYVSINTKFAQTKIRSHTFLYIPICFY